MTFPSVSGRQPALARPLRTGTVSHPERAAHAAAEKQEEATAAILTVLSRNTWPKQAATPGGDGCSRAASSSRPATRSRADSVSDGTRVDRPRKAAPGRRDCPRLTVQRRKLKLKTFPRVQTGPGNELETTALQRAEPPPATQAVPTTPLAPSDPNCKGRGTLTKAGTTLQAQTSTSASNTRTHRTRVFSRPRSPPRLVGACAAGVPSGRSETPFKCWTVTPAT